ncbi:MAG TPA: hypothetical protein VM680_00880 [Verrucomicrobiae bacterium]|nr:hypothetical protein [Verrucomicrobiae bacterium]
MKLIVLALLAAAVTVAPSFAGTREEEAIRALRGVPPPELAARAAQVVASTPPVNRSAVATAVLEAVSQRTPSSAPAVRSALINAGVLPSSVNVPPPVAAQAGSNSGKGNANGNGNSGNGNGNGTPPSNGGNVKTPNGNSRYPTAPPHGGNPPGHNGQPDRKGPPPFVDYTKPRSF